SCYGETPIYEAARHMAENRVSCLLIKDRDDSSIGYATDITLRDNDIAKQIDPAGPIYNVMDNPIVSIAHQVYLYEAVLMMFSTKTRYLLVEKEGKYVGFLSRNRILSEQGQSPLVFIQSVKLSETVEE